ncbi:hypothetical protein [Marinospirillum alkaliphilum]|uniref:Uncharacterized protein n=1 Tax=Marinospirillum alkaliphilum DSM 21637 TaxID=1122209 RepID=A0A1K1X518_9GAMM|nr:hypothetical protein [Marinospirillum alkaliphilum]SFX44785.1 hypothetical protein SAMN02745752_01722 [Marinospirillum alkaliphilum DSM 21637]
MTDSLWPKLRLKADTEENLIEAYRQVYLDTYVYDEQGNRRVFTDWTGASIIFAAGAFDHAFSKAKNYCLGTCVHDGGFDHERARRILWIAEVLAASAGTIHRYTQSKKDSRGRDRKRRTYVVVDESYVVVLDDPRKPDKPFTFVTAIAANPSYVQTEIKQKAFLAEVKKGG